MSHFMFTRRISVLMAMGALSISVFFAIPRVCAQDRPPSDPVASEQDRQHRVETPSQQLAEESREAAGEDENSQFKQSPSVRWIAKHTGLSLGGAFWLGIVVNFAILAAAIFWASKKNLPAMFRSRTVSIQRAMEEARKASTEANRRLSEIEARLSRLDVEIGEMRMAAEKEAAAEEERIKAAADEDARKIVESAEQEITAAAKAARRDLTAYAADLAVTLAKKQIHVDVATDQRLVRGFADQLTESRTNGTGSGSGKDGRS